MKNVAVRSVFAVGVLLILTPGAVQAQEVTYELKPPGQEQAAKSAQLECPETLLVGQSLQFDGTFENQGRVIIPEASFTVTVTPEFVLSNFTTTQGDWTTAPQNAKLDMGAVDPGVTVTFSFDLTAVAAGEATLEIQFSGQDPESCAIVVEDLPVENFVEVDQWDQTTALVQLVGGPLGDRPRLFILRGPTEVHVFFEGEDAGIAFDDDQNGLDEVPTELVALNLTDGTIRLTLNPQQRSSGQIEENVNTTRGLLDLPPFGQGDANSSFDVFFDIDVGGGLVLHNQLALQIQATISHKPPYERYIHLTPPGGPIELLDQNNNGTGIFIVRAEHDTGVVEHDIFEQTSALVQLVGGPIGETPQAFFLTGPAEALVFFEGPSEGEAEDDDGNGLDEVQTEMVQLDLVGTVSHPDIGMLDPNDGTVRLRLNPNQTSPGQIEEKENNTPGLLDLDPFASGDANSFFDVFFEIEVPDGQGGTIRLRNREALSIEATISEKPPLAHYVHLIPDTPIELFDENGNATGVFVVRAEHNTGFVEHDVFEQTTALLELQGGPFRTPTPFLLRGPAEVHVFFEGHEGDAFDDDGNGLDEVPTELVALNLTDGTIRLMLNPQQRSFGQIEEKENDNSGWLDLDPFHAGDADSFFDVFFEIEVGNQVLHNRRPFRIAAMISEKPPLARYVHVIPDPPIELFDENGEPTDITIVKAQNYTAYADLHRFTTRTQLSLVEPSGDSSTVDLTGTSALDVFYEGNSRRAAQDDDGDGLGEVQVELVSLDLTGEHPTLGPIMVRLRDPRDSPFMRSEGEMEERTDVDPDSLDPFGFIDAFLDVFVEVKIGSGENPMVFHNEAPKRVTTSFMNPLAPVVLTGLGMTPLVDEDGQPSGFGLGSVTQTDTPVSIEVDRVGEEIPTGFELEPNYPNPFTRRTVIPLGVPQASPVQIEVYDVLGRRVATLVDGTLAAGRHEVTWSPHGLPAGLYLIRLTVGNVVLTQRATLLR